MTDLVAKLVTVSAEIAFKSWGGDAHQWEAFSAGYKEAAKAHLASVDLLMGQVRETQVKPLEDAWNRICDACDEVDRDWMMHGPVGVDAVVALILKSKSEKSE